MKNIIVSQIYYNSSSIEKKLNKWLQENSKEFKILNIHREVFYENENENKNDNDNEDEDALIISCCKYGKLKYIER